jgi:hypothetical protein
LGGIFGNQEAARQQKAAKIQNDIANIQTKYSKMTGFGPGESQVVPGRAGNTLAGAVSAFDQVGKIGKAWDEMDLNKEKLAALKEKNAWIRDVKQAPWLEEAPKIWNYVGQNPRVVG